MKALPLHQIAAFCGGQLIYGDPEILGLRVDTDSRKVQPGSVFVALAGERFDAHEFLPQVAAVGVTAVIVSRVPDVPEALGCAIIQVVDTLLALQSLAREHRRLLPAKIIGITGSNGKTSTKDLTAAALGGKHRVFATAGNLNNHIGVPLTLLSMDESHEYGIVEMGMNHFGEIDVLAKIAEPEAAIITNIGVAHIEHMGSREGIAQEKGTLAEALPSSGFVVLNANDDFSPSMAARTGARSIFAGVGQGDVSAELLESGVHGSRFRLNFGKQASVEVALPIVGDHMVGNATLAAACAWSFGLSPEEIAEALSGAALTKGRLQIKTWKEVVFLDDSYNANPDSMKAGLKTLAAFQASGRRIAVLGRMGELGIHAESGHREIGAYAAQAGLDVLLTVGGAEAQWMGDAAGEAVPQFSHRHFATHAECADYLRQSLKDGDVVLLKGSRSSAMEQVLTNLDT